MPKPGPKPMFGSLLVLIALVVTACTQPVTPAVESVTVTVPDTALYLYAEYQADAVVAAVGTDPPVILGAGAN